ncbi:hypothetical protein [Chryseobacterium nematophagum]|nr:hypothetical protein [Chryseobacterium nematophagum]
MKSLITILFLISFSVDGQKVYKTPSGQKYHLSSCRMVKNVSSSLDVSNAIEQGLLPCKICKPSRSLKSSYSFISSTKKVNGVDEGNRCLGTTKKGARCKRYTRIGNDYCFQHVP